MSANPAAPFLSVVIPCWNDAAALSGILGTLQSLRGIGETIVADASSGDTCAEIARANGATLIRCERPSRGTQMNAGARVARGELLLFQHADTDLTQAHVDSLTAVADDRSILGGAFHRKFDSRHAKLRWLESFARLWGQLGGSFYGDQSIFVRRTVFESMSGYAEIPLMEDLEFCKRLRKRGRVELLDPPIASSPRHAQRYGSWRTSVRNATLISLFHCGVSPERLHRWYYRIPRTTAAARPCTNAMPDLPSP